MSLPAASRIAPACLLFAVGPALAQTPGSAFTWSTNPDQNAVVDPAIPAQDGASARSYMRTMRGVMSGVAQALGTRGQANGLAPLDATGRLPAGAVPSTLAPIQVQITGTGSTGDVSLMSATPSGGAGANTLARLLYGAAPSDGAASPSGRLATTAWVRQFGSGHANVLSCLSEAQILDVTAGIGALDLTATLQPCLSSFGSARVLWPAGTYRINGPLVPPPGQYEVGMATSWYAGSIITTASGSTVPIFKMTAGGGVEGFAFQTPFNTGAGQACVHVNNTNNTIVRKNFFYGCTDQVLIDGTSFYIEVVDNTFYAGAVTQLRVSSTSAPGVDLRVLNNRFLGSNGDANATANRTASVARFAGLGSLIQANNQISVSTTSGPAWWFETVAPLYGGVQSANNVFEQGGSQPAVYLQATAANPIKLFFSSNDNMTATNGPAMILDYVNKASFTNPYFSAVTTAGTIRFSAYCTVYDVNFISPNLEGDGAQSPFKTGGVGSVALTISNAKWQGGAPLVDFSSLSAGQLTSFDYYGGNPGAAANPFLLPAGGAVSIAYRGTMRLGNLPTSAPALSGSFWRDAANGNVLKVVP